jgi:hypothetical protein
MRHSTASARECARALWLLGLTPPVSGEELTRAWRARVSRSHPDLHVASESRSAAATLLTTALNDARRTVADWIESGREWPQAVRGDDAAARQTTRPRPHWEPVARPICRHTGLRPGDQVRVWPYDGEPLTVAGTEVEAGAGAVWVLFGEGGAERAERVRLAAYSCPVCGQCAGPERDRYVLRPCPECLVDLRRLERRPVEAARVRSAIEARAESGRATAAALGAEDLGQRAVGRRRWARRLRGAGQEDLHAALVGAFTRAYERWASPPPPAG